MGAYIKGSLDKRFNRLMGSVISGNAGVTKTILVFSLCALLLLVYVTTQIYSSLLSERISNLEKEQLVFRERIYTRTGEHTRLGSRERIAAYCEDVLGMVEANNENMKRIAVEFDDDHWPEHGKFTERRRFVPEVLGRTVKGETKKE